MAMPAALLPPLLPRASARPSGSASGRDAAAIRGRAAGRASGRGNAPGPGHRPCISPNEFREAVYAKGWTLQELAERWDYSLSWLCKLIAKPDRPAQVDDALRGLPRIGRPRTVPARWREGAQAQPAPASSVPRSPGLRYAGYMVLGAVVAVNKPLGSMAEEGMRGIVVEVQRSAGATALASETYRVIFETGAIEVFTPELVDEYLVTTGLERQALQGYRYATDDKLSQDYDSGMFEFW